MDINMKTIGFPRMHKEKNEKRDFIPEFFKQFIDYEAEIYIEKGYGGSMGIEEVEYLAKNPKLKFVSNKECYEKDIVVVIRCPQVFELDYMKEGSTLVSMLHYSTRATRIEYLKKRNIFGVSMDSIRNDLLERIVVDYRGTSGNGVDIAFKELEIIMKKHSSFERKPINVSVIGMGSVGLMAAKYAGRFGSYENEERFQKYGIDSVMINMLSRNITNNISMMKQILSQTDILVDASNRHDSSKYIISNHLLESLKQHAVILDLSADPYLEDIKPMQVKGIEGIPTGNLDRYVFKIQDSVYDKIPQNVCSKNRRVVVSCNAWPGIVPQKCMELYGIQLIPMLKRLIKRNKKEFSEKSDNFFARAIYRSTIEFFEKIK